MQEEGLVILSHTQGKGKVPSGLGFGFSNPPSCMSSKAKETFKTWKKKCRAYIIAQLFPDLWGSWDMTLGSDRANTVMRGEEVELKRGSNVKEK